MALVAAHGSTPTVVGAGADSSGETAQVVEGGGAAVVAWKRHI